MINLEDTRTFWNGSQNFGPLQRLLPQDDKLKKQWTNELDIDIAEDIKASQIDHKVPYQH